MASAALNGKELEDFRQRLMAWYRHSRRDLPWRRTSDPYAIWVSEVMLQQTRVAAVEERYRQFLDRYPTVGALAAATEEEVLALWSGLGYYRRARMLHQGAQAVVERFGGAVPRTVAELKTLPGIGAYTAAAIGSIAFGEPEAVVDGNVERVTQRVAGWGADGSTSPAELRRNTRAMAQKLLDPEQPGDFNQAMMELGATICLPRNPQCLACPVQAHCRTKGEHATVKRAPMTRREVGYALVLRGHGPALRGAGRARAVLLQQRPASETVMPGMWELPGLLSSEIPEDRQAMRIRHAIMQVNYAVAVRHVDEVDLDALCLPGGERRWARLEELNGLPLTGLARKVLTRAGLFAARGRK